MTMFEEREDHSVLVDIVKYLHRLMTDEGIVWWLTQPMEKFGGRTPLKALQDGDFMDVLAVAESYGDSSFT